MEKVTFAVKKIDNVITRGARQLITKGGTFEGAIRETVDKVAKQYPELDRSLLAKGFYVRYVEQVNQRAR